MTVSDLKLAMRRRYMTFANSSLERHKAKYGRKSLLRIASSWRPGYESQFSTSWSFSIFFSWNRKTTVFNLVKYILVFTNLIMCGSCKGYRRRVKEKRWTELIFPTYLLHSITHGCSCEWNGFIPALSILVAKYRVKSGSLTLGVDLSENLISNSGEGSSKHSATFCKKAY